MKTKLLANHRGDVDCMHVCVIPYKGWPNSLIDLTLQLHVHVIASSHADNPCISTVTNEPESICHEMYGLQIDRSDS